jgi:hypothetical protein
MLSSNQSTSHKVEHKAREAKEKTKHGAEKVKHEVEHGAEKAKHEAEKAGHKMKHKAHDIKHEVCGCCWLIVVATTTQCERLTPSNAITAVGPLIGARCTRCRY